MKKHPLALILLSVLFAFNPISLLVPAQIGVQANDLAYSNPAASVNQANTITQVSPTSCPDGGCAAGQRINFQVNFDVAPQTTSGPNTQVNLYTASNNYPAWIDTSSFSYSGNGWSNGDATGGTCPVPPDYSLLYKLNASLQNGPSSSLGFVFRIDKSISSTSISNPIIVVVCQVDSGGTIWSQSSSITLSNPLVITSASSPAFVANDVDACAGNSPCYLNSGDDLADGVGTGLKDAVDALPSSSTINILGNYPIKENAVNVNQADSILGVGNATLTTSSCSGNPVLLVGAGASIRYLNLNANCNSRDLLFISSPTDVSVEYNDLTGGKNAVVLAGNNGTVKVRFNQIHGNRNYGIVRSSGSGSILAIANNIYGNRSGVQADCGGIGQVDHNYWGGQAVSVAVTNCAVTNGKRLGAPILQNASSPGVDAYRVTVTGSKEAVENLGLSVQHNSGSDFDIYVVNHGHGSNSNIPFFGNGTDAIIACGNFLDVFLAENVSNPATLSLYFKYDLNPDCIPTITEKLCNQTADPSKYPLWWYDPQNNVTDRWDSTGQTPAGSGANGASGQTTACLLDSNEVEVTLINGGRPGLSQDLNFTPFIAGYYPVGFLSFTTKISVSKATIQWETSYESGISGYYIVRSLQQNGTYSRTIGPIAHLGNGTIGGIYSYDDSTLNFGTTYYYKIEIIGADGSTLGFYGPVAAVTATATPTATFTFTITQTFTKTNTPTITSTRTPTRTYTPYVSRTYTPSPYRSRTPSRTITPYRTSTPLMTNTPFHTSTLEGGSPSPDLTTSLTTSIATDANGYPITDATAIAMLTNAGTGQAESLTPQLTSGTGTILSTPTPTKPSTTTDKATFWVSLITGGVLGIIVLGSAGWFLFQRRMIQ